jgi:hypothetical protein
MFLTLNKKKLKELSQRKIPNSFTRQVNGGGDTSEMPSKTSNARCLIEVAERVAG